ncbi:hypothetical protein D3C87_2039440 [compost metagenome]
MEALSAPDSGRTANGLRKRLHQRNPGLDLYRNDTEVCHFGENHGSSQHKPDLVLRPVRSLLDRYRSDFQTGVLAHSRTDY